MLQSNDYQEIKTYFERNCQYGFIHIRAWIMSPQFHAMYIKDRVKAHGSAIQVGRLEPYVEDLLGVNHSIKGYKIMVSDGFTEEFGVCYIADRGISEIAETLLKDNVSKDYNIKKKI